MVVSVGACCLRSWFFGQVWICLDGLVYDRLDMRTRLFVRPCFLVAQHEQHGRRRVPPRQEK